MKGIVITSFPPSWKELADITTATHKRWALRHGYAYYADCSDVSAPARSPEWGKGADGYIPLRGFIKLDLMLHFLNPESCREQYDRVIWLDADLMITNDNIPPSRWTDATDAGVIVPFDFNSHNATVMIAQNTKLVYDFLWASNNAGRTMFLKHDWAEMWAMREFSLMPPYTNILHHVSIKELCALLPGVYLPALPARVSAGYEWEQGDFACHLAALPLARRIELAKSFKEIES